ncbi:MAG: Panacea domain-containing protein [Bacteroidota bacterium]
MRNKTLTLQIGILLGFNFKKSVQALNFFAIQAGGTINKMKALKLIWLSDRLHLRFYSRPIVNDTYFALNYGPVASGTKDLVENTSFLTPIETSYRNQFIRTDAENIYQYYSIAPIDPKVFSQTDLAMMRKIFETFGHLTEFELSEESHKYPEWKRFESHLESKTASRFEMDYKDFFAAVQGNQHNIFSLDEVTLEDSKAIFIENGYIYQLV